MEVKSKKYIWISIYLLAAFALWTILVSSLDIKPIGPNGSMVGFATINQYFHNLIGVNMLLYHITDWLSLIPILFVICFAIMGFTQMIHRKHILRVDPSILILGCFYILVVAAYMFFEIYTINYRPVLINGKLESSYPSSTTMLVMCVMPTSIIQLQSRISSIKLRQWSTILLMAYMIFMVTGRILSGVHWITDIIGGVLLSSGLVLLYYGNYAQLTKHNV